jgi:hypothetical protein
MMKREETIEEDFVGCHFRDGLIVFLDLWVLHHATFRATRLGEFSAIGRLFTFGSF